MTSAFRDTKFLKNIICVQFTNYTKCIISNNLFNYSIQRYEDVLLANKRE